MDKNNRLEEYEKEKQEEPEIWSWGAGTDGQLATVRLQDEHSPQRLRSLSAFGPFTSLSCGGAHVIALTPGGRVFTWGRGTSGQLGHGEMINCLQPNEVKALEGFVVTRVSAGWNHSGFVTDNGAVFTCGDGLFGQLGHGDYESKCSPLEVLYFSSKNVEQVACGMRHTLALLKGNVEHKVYGFGSGKRGQLGSSTGIVKSTSVPQATLCLTDFEIVSICANGDHSAALSATGSLYTWGRGYRNASHVCIPHRVDTALSFHQVALGWNHALLLTREGKLYMLGGDHHGVLGNPHKTPWMKDEPKQDILLKLIDLEETSVLQIAAGAEHSALVTDNGSVMTWGWGEHGQLGLGNTVDKTCPRLVNLGSVVAGKHVISSVYCGSGFCFVLQNFGVNSQVDVPNIGLNVAMTS
ncbi:ultraviolet-B receptor UVR8 isoform X1 [Primulina huaijiensis]|uniref:ultraviolet-B receptor UVR8 isoform X1 n=1 Tax=Primulina huaijiensis TaxID=1492673 RepID=UPI003CC7031C